MLRPLRAALLLLLASPALVADSGEGAFLDAGTREETVQFLIREHGDPEGARIRRGVGQVADRWWRQDGDAARFREFCTTSFVTDPSELAQIFDRLQQTMEQIDGHLHEIRREIRTPFDLDTGPTGLIDDLLSRVDLSAHVSDDLFRSQVAFLALLNFPVHTLDERLEQSAGWDRESWARSRMMDRFALRVPASVSQQATLAFDSAGQYIANYNVRMDRLVDSSGELPFPEGLRLITHWGLRDELKAQYGESDGLERQRMIQRVMESIARQEIPFEVIDNGDLLWDPESQTVWSYDADRGEAGEVVVTTREPDTRYERLLDTFHAVRLADAFAPTAPTYIERRFNLGREIPEREVKMLLISVLRSKEFKALGALIAERLGRPLEPFDIWYDGFKSRGEYGQRELDRIVSERYPEVASFQSGLPRVLTGLGFNRETSAWLAERIVVDPSRGAGHAMGAARREDQAHLRTRFGPDGMDYKGYNIAIHELGHNVEQVFSLNAIDHWWLNGVPNNAFTEALAFVFQNRDLELLGLAERGGDARQMEALDTLWGTAEIGAVALVDMDVWRWLYRNPQATPAELREATLKIARDVWNRYFAPVFGVEDQEILAIYSHMISYALYLPDYPLGHMIAFQVAAKMREGDFGEEFERMSLQGRLTPDAWMRGAVGGPISAEALLAAAGEAIEALR